MSTKKNSFTILNHPVFLTMILVVVYDFIVRLLFHSLHPVTFIATAVCLFFSLSFWFFIYHLRNLLPKTVQLIFNGVIAFSFTIILLSNFVTYKKFGEFVTGYMLLFIGNDKSIILDNLRIFFLGPPLIIAVPLFILLNWIWQPTDVSNVKMKIKDFVFKITKVFASLVFALIFLNQLHHETNDQHIWVDSSFVLAYRNFITAKNTNTLRASVRMQVNAPQKLVNDQPDIILFLGESFGKKFLPFYGHNQNTMPYLSEYLKAENAFIFQKGLTNSGATDVSLPSLLTGIGSEVSQELLHQMPLLWQWAQSAGYFTVFSSSQRLGFANFMQFIKSPPPDMTLSADKIGGKIVNDAGMDDISAAKFVVHEIRKNVPKGKPLLFVYFTSATHYPFAQTSTELNIQPNFKSKYENSLFLTDHVFKTIIDFVKERNPDNNYTLLISGDHGELENEPRGLPRVASFYDEIVGVPFIFKPHSKINETHAGCVENVKKNLETNVQNLDLLPTIIDLMGFTKNENSQIQMNLKGSSLCRKISQQRTIIGINTNDIRHWNPEGFFIANNQYRYVYSNVMKEQIFNVSNDPDQKVNILNSVDPGIKHMFSSIVKENRHLNRIFDLYQK